ncbi:MAG: pyrroloquinoline quinone-dependent dehydrogenase [Acidobacteria bacterium]|nr:MAG: pyrroloquinoline quinone-dependent dehydrogenase [Acidobacteriota bacterium]
MMSHSSRRPAVLATLAVTAAVSAASYLIAQTRPPAGEWRHYSGDTDGAKYSALAQIDKDNVRNLRVAWRWQTPDRALQLSDPQRRAGRNEQTPLMVNGTLYTVSGLGLVAALDPGSGATQWVYDPESYHAGVPNNGGFLQRGFAYWADGSRERLLVGTADAYLLSVDARTGKPDLGFGTRGKADLTIGIRDAVRAVNYTARRPLVAGNVVVVGSSILDYVFKKEEPPGYVHGFDVRTGKLLWTFNTIPRPGELGYDTWLDNSAEYSGSTNVWAGGIYDPELDYIYLPSSTPTNNYYGGHRLGDNLFAESLICVQAKTGRRVWHFQAVHHGIWDYDFPAHPILGDITVNGRRIKAVIQVSKQGFTYVFDRKTGQPVWPIEERPVAASTVPGERTSPTQPFPTKPPAFETQGSTEANLIDFTPELRKRALEKLTALEHGPLFTPLSAAKGNLLVPGIAGGANWGGAGFDRESGVLYVPSRTAPTLLSLVGVDPKQGDMRYVRADLNSGAGMDSIDGLPIIKPPYSRLTAIDLNRGEHLWMAPLGSGPRDHPLLKDLNLPPLGDRMQGVSVLVTKTLVIASAIPTAAPSASEATRRLLFVFDKQTGAPVHTVELDAFSAAAPMTYMHRGKQYIVVATGSGPNSELVALSLP